MGLWDKYEYKPGLTFGSKTSAHIEVIRPKEEVYALNGQKVNEIRELVAEFGTHNPEYQWKDSDDHMHTAPDIRGYFFDLDQWADQNDLSAEDRDYAAKKLLLACDKHPEYIWLHSKTPAAKPWPKYDETAHGKVAELASTLGLSVAALVYEQENKNRKSVVEALQADIARAVEVEVGEESLTAA